jgi:hypothetical protein
MNNHRKTILIMLLIFSIMTPLHDCYRDTDWHCGTDFISNTFAYLLSISCHRNGKKIIIFCQLKQNRFYVNLLLLQ